MEVPQLRDPCLIAGFYGWSDAGSVSSDVLAYLAEALQPRLIGTIEDEHFINYVLNRPVAQIEEGVIRQMEPCQTELRCWGNPGSGSDLVCLLGKEPHMNWFAYVDTILDAVKRLGIKRIFTIGGVQDATSHTRPPIVSAVGSSPYALRRILTSDETIKLADYHGPVSIHSCLIKRCMEKGMEAVSLWGHVPAYLQKNPRVVTKIITILNKAVGMDCPLEMLRHQTLDLEHKLQEALSRDPNLRRLVESLENEGSSEKLPGEEKVIRLNDFLRRDLRKDPDPL